MSDEPRPRIRPSTSLPDSGSNCQSLTGFQGMVSTWPLKSSDRAEGSPRCTPTTLGRPVKSRPSAGTYAGCFASSARSGTH